MIVLQDKNYVEVECSHCHSLLGVHISDISYHEITHRTPPFTATCGACGKTTGVPEKDIPRDWIPGIVDE